MKTSTFIFGVLCTIVIIIADGYFRNREVEPVVPKKEYCPLFHCPEIAAIDSASERAADLFFRGESPKEGLVRIIPMNHFSPSDTDVIRHYRLLDSFRKKYFPPIKQPE